MRRAGLILPLFSAASSSGCGIGELRDLGPLASWMAGAGFTRLMILPLGTMADDQASPYSASSASAIDPIYISALDEEDFVRAGGVGALSAEAVRALEAARAGPQVRHADVRLVKREALDRAFDRFAAEEWQRRTPRAIALAHYCVYEHAWLDDYALFQALGRAFSGRPWWDWPAALRDREPRALADARRELDRDVLKHQYFQWLAELEWAGARAAAASCGVSVVGDLPFMVNAHSADVWARPDEFLLDVSIGAPPDAFSAAGQDWGLPMYRWEAMARTDYAWLRLRARRLAALFGSFRVDHLVGFYRTYGTPRKGRPFFTPTDEIDQLAQGERILRAFLDSGAEVFAEDLGTVPDFVRASMARIGVPGCKVVRWERRWHEPGQPFVDPDDYPPVSWAATGTHDTDSVASWWDHAPSDERAALVSLPSFGGGEAIDATTAWNDGLRDALLGLTYRAASADVFVPMMDVFGWRDRINTPATVNDRNWTWRLPWPIDRWSTQPEAVERAAFCRALAHRTGRFAPDAGPAR